jgi:hypothetical protein
MARSPKRTRSLQDADDSRDWLASQTATKPKRKPWPSTKNVGEFEFPALPGVSTASKRARQSAGDLAALRASGSASTPQGKIGIKEAERRAFRDKVTEGAARSPGKPERTTFMGTRREDDSIAGLAEVTTSRARKMRESDQKQERVEKNLARLRSGGHGRSDMVRRAAPPSGLAPAEDGAAQTPTDPRVAQLAALRKDQRRIETSLGGSVSDRRFEANRAKIADIEGAQLNESRAATQRQQGIDEQRTALDEASKRRIGEAEAISGIAAGREEASDTRRATRETQAQDAKATESRFLASQKLASVEQQNDYINKSKENAAVFQNASNMLANLGKTIFDEENSETTNEVRLEELKEQQSLIRDGLLSRMKDQGFALGDGDDAKEPVDLAGAKTDLASQNRDLDGNGTISPTEQDTFAELGGAVKLLELNKKQPGKLDPEQVIQLEELVRAYRARVRKGIEESVDKDVSRAAPPSGLDPYSEGAARGPYASGQAPVA